MEPPDPVSSGTALAAAQARSENSPHLHRLTAAVDFDGVIIPDSKDTRKDVQMWRVCHLLPEPLPGVCAGLAWLRKQGYEVIIHTARPHADREFIEAILRKAGARELVDLLMFYTKPHAALYIDDKAIRFTSWADVPGQLSALNGRDGGSPSPSQEPNTLFEEWLKRRRWVGLEKLVGVPDRRQGWDILDIGCGRAPYYPDWVRKVSIVEPDKASRELARRNEPRITAGLPVLRTEDVLGTWMFAPAEFDCVTLCGVLEHVDDPVQFLKQFTGAQRIFITVPNADSFHRRVGQRLGLLQDRFQLSPADLAIGHRRYYNAHTLASEVVFALGIDWVHYEWTSGFKVGTNAQMAHLLGAADAIADEFEALAPLHHQPEIMKLGAECCLFLQRRGLP